MILDSVVSHMCSHALRWALSEISVIGPTLAVQTSVCRRGGGVRRVGATQVRRLDHESLRRTVTWVTLNASLYGELHD